MSVKDTISEIKALKDNQIITNKNVLEQHSRGEDYFLPKLPDAVFYANSTNDVSDVIKICAKNKTPVVPFGSGTSLEGHVSPDQGGISINLTNMNKIIETNEKDLDCRVQAGVSRILLNDNIKNLGLFFPVDPGAREATLGGMTATNASGTNAVKYGTMKNNVLGLTVVTPDGKIIHTGGRTKKSSAGYDLTKLFIGSEGTLGIITEIQLRLYGIPEFISSAICHFDTLEGAVKSSMEIIQYGIPVARIELLDEVQMKASKAYSKLSEVEIKPTLFFEFHGTKESTEEQSKISEAICTNYNGHSFKWAHKTEDRNRLWKARHDAYYAALSISPNKRAMSTDVCVPLSKLADCIIESKLDLEKNNIIAPMVGHVGDGNFHLLMLCDPNNNEEMKKFKKTNDRLVKRAISMGGTCTGEHGIGLGKKEYLKLEHPTNIELMKKIKNIFDPNNIMNPNKIIDN
ncbi:MAG: putative FAD-linked oxidoreductase [Alphaproteobacteria bacterium MarineAlpha5_Bin12]|nr:FAD-binding oxidoreductase [Pelagibacteraceae bacterium]PPR41802.1 MAG: putative FAD-linked oxidoreductase [Alphaproteobacteria bacterium MarineAlpha5_Bin12]|tara:strand:+ start:4829 stop:6205 length:1377 start_codon:yes stop_codon:yes gene_type:complete